MKISKSLMIVIACMCFSILQSFAATGIMIRNGYEYLITQKPGTMVEYRAKMTGREQSRWGSDWYAITSYWYQDGLPCLLNELEVTDAEFDSCERLDATGENLTDIIKFNVAGLQTAKIGSEADNPVKCYIRTGAFKTSTKLNSLTLTSAVAAIESSAFEGMKSGYIICEGKTPPSLASNAFSEEGYNNITVYVPDGCVSQYKSSSWRNFNKILPISERDLIFYFKPSHYTISVGETVELTLSDFISPGNLTWTSSDEKIATVLFGDVKGIKPGQAIVTATHINGNDAACRITVIQPVKNITFNLENCEFIDGAINVTVGDSQKISVTLSPSDATDQLTWESSNQRIVEIDQDGVLTAKAEGSAKISVTAESGVSASVDIVVNPPAKTITLDRKEWNGLPGESFNLVASILPVTPINQSVKWKSSDDEIATVDANGDVTAGNPGNAIISATTSNGLVATCSVSVYPQSILIDGVKYVIAVGGDKDGKDMAKAIGCASEHQESISIPSEIEFNGSTYPVKEISERAFQDCAHLTSIVISNSVTSISDQAFYGCSELKNLNIKDGTENLSVGKDVFYNCPLEKLYLGRNTSSSDSPFREKRTLLTVTIGNDVTTVGQYAFYCCSRVTSLTIGDNVTSIGQYAFYGCYDLASFAIGKSVTTIETEAFRYCSSLISLTIGNSITSVHWYAFRDCRNLKHLTIEDGSEDLFLDSNVFNNCPLETLYLGRNIKGNYGSASPFQYKESLSTVTISNTVTKINYTAFRNCPNLTSISIGNGVTSIGESAFENCTSLTSFTIGKEVTTIEKNAFYGCSKLKDLTIEDGSEILSFNGKDIFSGCGIETLYLGRNISYPLDNYYYSSPFSYSWSLYTIIIGNLVSYIPRYAFTGSGLTSVTIPESVTFIGSQAFSNCSSLRSVTIPASIYDADSEVFNADSEVFKGCSSLKSVYYKAKNPYRGFSSTFDSTTDWTSVYGRATLYVPAEAVAKCKEIDPWKNFNNIVAYNFESGIEDVTADKIDFEHPYDFYTLDGMRVAGSTDALAPGIYIVRQGNVVKKIVVK